MKITTKITFENEDERNTVSGCSSFIPMLARTKNNESISAGKPFTISTDNWMAIKDISYICREVYKLMRDREIANDAGGFMLETDASR